MQKASAQYVGFMWSKQRARPYPCSCVDRTRFSLIIRSIWLILCDSPRRLVCLGGGKSSDLLSTSSFASSLSELSTVSLSLSLAPVRPAFRRDSPCMSCRTLLHDMHAAPRNGLLLIKGAHFKTSRFCWVSPCSADMRDLVPLPGQIIQRRT